MPKKIELKGWDISYVTTVYIRNLEFLIQEIERLQYNLAEQEAILAPLGGNPYALNILNELCKTNKLDEIFEKLTDQDDISSYLLKQLSVQLPSNQITALQNMSQFIRELSREECLKYICNEETLESLIFRNLVIVSFNKTYSIHPLTASQFSLNDDIVKKTNCVNHIISKINDTLSSKNINDIYAHNLARQIMNMQVQSMQYESAAELFIQIGTRILSLGDIQYLKTMLEFFMNSNISDILKMRMLKIKAHIQSNADNLELANQIYETMLKKSIEYNDAWSKSAALNGLGSMQRYIYNYEKALQYYTESLTIRLENHMDLECSNSYHNLGATYIIMGDYDNAINALENACTIRTKYDDRFRLSASLLYLGESYTLKEEYKLGEKHLLRSISIKEETKDSIGIIWGNLALAKLYVLSSQIEKLISLKNALSDSEKNAIKLKVMSHLPLIKMYRGIEAFFENNSSDAISFYSECVGLCSKSRNSNLKADIGKLISITLESSLKSNKLSEIQDIVKKYKI